MILVTGGAGFIGSNFVLEWLQAEGSPLVNLDKLTYAGNLNNLAAIRDDTRHVFVRGDICDAALVASLLKQHRPRAVVHLAAESHVDRSIHGPADFIQTNVVGTLTLLEAVRAFWSALPARERHQSHPRHLRDLLCQPGIGQVLDLGQRQRRRRQRERKDRRIGRIHLAVHGRRGQVARQQIGSGVDRGLHVVHLGRVLRGKGGQVCQQDLVDHLALVEAIERRDPELVPLLEEAGVEYEGVLQSWLSQALIWMLPLGLLLLALDLAFLRTPIAGAILRGMRRWQTWRRERKRQKTWTS